MIYQPPYPRPMFVLSLILSAFVASTTSADSGQKGDSLESGNYEKSKELLPGEEVVTPTGQRIKVWSTKGPVRVSRPPEPFQDPEATQVDDVDVVIDGRHKQVRKPVDRQTQEERPSKSPPPSDSFDIRKK